MTANEGKRVAAGVNHCHPHTVTVGIVVSGERWRQVDLAPSGSPTGLAFSPSRPCSYGTMCSYVVHFLPLKRSAVIDWQHRRERCYSTSQLPG